MKKDKTYIIRMRDCFTGGYTLPQYCIDNEIKKPLFVSEKKFLNFIWEIYVQFIYDKRMKAQFGLLDKENGKVNYSVKGTLAPLKYENFSKINLADFDAIILLTADKKDFSHEKIIPLDKLLDYFIRKTYYEIPVLNFLQRYPQVKLIVARHPRIRRYKDGLKFNSQLKSLMEIRQILKNDDSGNLKTPLDCFGYTNQQVLELVEAPKLDRKPDGSVGLKDTAETSFKRVKNGKRETACQPENFLNRIYFVGSCHQFGVNAPFDKTIESYLQKMLNENNLSYRVENEGQHYFDRHQDLFYNLNELTPAPGDIIFIWVDNPLPKNLPILDLSDAFDPPHDYKKIFCTRGHVNELGYEILAKKYFEFLTENNFFREKNFNYPLPPPKYHRYGIPPQFESGGMKNFAVPELDAYKEKLRAKKIPVGAIVMNCNPFTLGHQYLVEYAAAKVARLYIFVVEEDRSEFPFADRIELVKQGVKNFSNVEVLPSGKFIISQQTFSGYFNKAELQNVQVDSSEDVEIFGREIAPTLGITIRFAGEEPKDNVKRQYNETMKRILPRYGVEFQEIPRKTFDGEFISASSVREALKRGDFDKIKKLVPESTFNYLRGRAFTKKI